MILNWKNIWTKNDIRKIIVGHTWIWFRSESSTATKTKTYDSASGACSNADSMFMEMLRSR